MTQLHTGQLRKGVPLRKLWTAAEAAMVKRFVRDLRVQIWNLPYTEVDAENAVVYLPAGGGGKESIPISFWPELRRDEEGHPELVLADGLVRLVGHGYIPFEGGTFPAAWGHCAWIARNYADCNNAGSWNFGAGGGVQFGPEPEESLEAGVIVLCRIVGGTGNEQLAINRIGDQDVFDLVRRVEPVPLYDPEIVFDPALAPIVADAGSDVEAVIGSTIVFDGRGSTTDERIRIVSYHWSGGPSGNLHGERPARKFTAAGEWTLTLTVQDQAGRQDTDTVTVTIIDPEAE